MIQKKFKAMDGLKMKNVLMIGFQLLQRLKVLHSLGYVHGDIKPANIVFGKGKKKNILYLIDFGITQKESSLDISKHDASIYDMENLKLNGTPLYASINLHLGWDKVFKKDDLESFVYLLIYLTKGTLPWKTIPNNLNDNYEAILKAKMQMKTESI